MKTKLNRVLGMAAMISTLMVAGANTCALSADLVSYQPTAGTYEFNPVPVDLGDLDLTEQYANALSDAKKAALWAVSKDGAVISIDQQLFAVWTRKDEGGNGHLFLKHFGNEVVNVQLELDYTSDIDTWYNNGATTPLVSIEPGEQVDLLVTSMPFGGSAGFELYNVEYDPTTGEENSVYLATLSW